MSTLDPTEPRATCLPWETGTTATPPARQRNRGTRTRQALHETARVPSDESARDASAPHGRVRRRFAIPVCCRPLAREPRRRGRAAPCGGSARAEGAETFRGADAGCRELGRAHGGI